MKKSLMICSFILVILFSITFILAFSGTGSGTLASPYVIINCTQLQEMNESLTANYSLGNNINCSDTLNWNSGKGFLPVGSCGDLGACYSEDYSNTFQGNFNGNGFNITNLFIGLRDSFSGNGLFGYSSGKISNLNVLDANVTGWSSVGIIFGVSFGEVSNSFSSGYVEGVGIGGLGGENFGIINNSNSSVKIVGGNGEATDAGGLVGYSEGNIYNSHVTGNISAESYRVGGLVGYAKGEIYDSSFSGSVIGTEYVGGLVGSAEDALIFNSITAGDVFGSIYVGGLIGYIEDNTLACYINNSYSNVSITLGANTIIANVGGIVGGFSSYGGIYNSSYSGIINLTSSGIIEGYSIGGFVGDFYYGSIANSNSSGEIYTNLDPASSQDMGGFVGLVNNGLINNSFSKTFINLNGGADYNYIGGFAGLIEDTSISNSYATGEVYTFVGYNIGGFAGKINNDEDEEYLITNSYSTGNVFGISKVGGFAGENYGEIYNCYSRGNVSFTYGGTIEDEVAPESVGGFAGYNGLNIFNSYSAGNVYVNSEGTLSEIVSVSGIGGFVGTNEDISASSSYSIYSSYSTGNVLIDVGDLELGFIGGFIGLNNDINYSNSGWIVQDGLDAIGFDWILTEAIAEIDYNENSANVFYSKNHGVYTNGASVWNFSHVWEEHSDSLPTLRINDSSASEEIIEEVEEVVEEESSSSSSTYAPKIYYLDFLILSGGNEFNLKVADKVKFKINNTNHTLTLTYFNDSSARVMIQSEPFTIYLQKGISYEFDLNLDGKNDTLVRYDGTLDKKAKISIQEIISKTEIVEEKPVVDSFTPEEQSGIFIWVIFVLIFLGIVIYLIWTNKHFRKRLGFAWF